VSIVEIVNDDMPFLLDSVLGELAEWGLRVQFVAHPVFAMERDEAGLLFAFRGTGTSGHTGTRESFIHVHVDRVDDEARRREIARSLEQVLGEVRQCVKDWKPMVARVNEIVADLKVTPPLLPGNEVSEAVQFLEWLAAENFTFLGFRSYVFPERERNLAPQFESGLGILRDDNVRVLRRGRELVTITPEIMEFLNEPRVLIITKANVRSRVHRRVHMDYIGVKHFDVAGNLIANTASSACSPRAPIPARSARFRICATRPMR